MARCGRRGCVRNPVPGRGTGRQANAGLIAARSQQAPAPIPKVAPAPLAPVAAPTPPPVDEWSGHRGKPLPTPPAKPSAWESFMYGEPGRMEEYNRFTPEQQSAMSALLGQGMQGLQRTPLDFGPIAEQARKQFREETIPGLAERFTALGGGQRSSAFGQQLGRAGSDLESNLASLGSQYNLQKFGALTNLSRLGLEPQLERVYFPGQGGFASSFAQQGAQGMPAAADLAVKGLGSALGSWWSGGGAAQAATEAGAAEAGRRIANSVSPEVAKAATSGGWQAFKNAIWPTLVGGVGGALGTFPLLPAAIFAGLLGAAGYGLYKATE